MNCKTQYYYMAVSADDLELPIAHASTMKELAVLCRTTVEAIKSNLYRGISGRNTGIKYVRVLCS